MRPAVRGRLVTAAALELDEPILLRGEINLAHEVLVMRHFNRGATRWIELGRTSERLSLLSLRVIEKFAHPYGTISRAECGLWKERCTARGNRSGIPAGAGNPHAERAAGAGDL